MQIRIPNRFKPYPYQRTFMEYLDTGGKHAFWVVHRRGGKDLTAMHQTCKMMHQRVGAYWHVYPTFPQARKAIWEGFTSKGERILDQVFPPELIESRNNQEMFIRLKCGSTWWLLGSDKIEVVGAGAVGVVYSEYAVARPRAAELISPMLMQNGGWEAYITTPRGNNHAKKLYDIASKNAGWYCDLKTLYDTNGETYERSPDVVLAEERARGKPEALIRQEYLCDWSAANVGSVFGDLVEAIERDARTGLEYQSPTDGVFTSWDLGISDATAIWFWRLADNGIDVIDHHEATGKPLSYFFDYLDSKGYKYRRHWLPHDARARSLQTGISTVEQFVNRYGMDSISITPELNLADGLQAARWLLQQPIRFHKRCNEGVEALKAYHYLWDEDRKVLASKPEHDWSSHSADAFRYLALVLRHSEAMNWKPKVKQPELPRSVGSFTMDEMWAINDRERRARE